jgi:hypothetical protein
MSTELKIRLKASMLSIKNGLIAETHSIPPPGESSKNLNYGIKTIANNITCTVSPFSLLGWLRHGITEYLISLGISPCHSYDLTNISNEGYRNIAIQDLEHGYHKKRLNKGENTGKPECEATIGTQCIVAQIFGGFTGHHRVFSVMPVKVSPVKAHYNKGVRNITGRGNYRNIAVSPRSAVDGTPLATHTADVIANLDAILYLKMYEDNPLYIAMIMRGFEYLYEHRDEFECQLGGSRTFGSGFIEPTFLPSALTREETTKYHNLLITTEEEDASNSDSLPESIKTKISEWQDEQKKLNTILDNELKIQKDMFGIDKRWWSREI